MQIVNEHLAADAHRIEIGGGNVVNKNIDHKYLICEEPDKLHVLVHFLKSQQENRGLVGFGQIHDQTCHLPSTIGAPEMKELCVM